MHGRSRGPTTVVLNRELDAWGNALAGPDEPGFHIYEEHPDLDPSPDWRTGEFSAEVEDTREREPPVRAPLSVSELKEMQALLQDTLELLERAAEVIRSADEIDPTVKTGFGIWCAEAATSLRAAGQHLATLRKS